ncbi:MAG: energy transducer TonB [Terracidiphilus sp.]|nr:energy transducer TonB [Terracidiphilus sp.]MDR3799090.1 energy transducer TonB [Terracidiphilus sp.]
MPLIRLRVALSIAVCFIASSTAFCTNRILTSSLLSESRMLGDVPSTVRPLTIPQDVAVDMLIYKVTPEYPVIAKAARVSGIVTLQATISKTGEISDLHVICGPVILQQASLEAVRQWKYRPYLLNGKPVEVETTIRITFALGGKKKMKFSKDSCPSE